MASQISDFKIPIFFSTRNIREFLKALFEESYMKIDFSSFYKKFKESQIFYTPRTCTFLTL